MSVQPSAGTASSILGEFGRQAIAQGDTVSHLGQKMGMKLTEYRALPDARPLCFLHIPKTAGAAIIEWLRSMFSPDDFAPYAIEDEFEALRLDPREYRLYAGHI